MSLLGNAQKTRERQVSAGAVVDCRCPKAATHWPWVAGVADPKNPMVDRCAGCCASAVGGHAARDAGRLLRCGISAGLMPASGHFETFLPRPLDPRFRNFAPAAGTAEKCHVWTAPAVQEENWTFARSVRLQPCIRPLNAASGCGPFDGELEILEAQPQQPIVAQRGPGKLTWHGGSRAPARSSGTAAASVRRP